jgi:hypothetical protein
METTPLEPMRLKAMVGPSLARRTTTKTVALTSPSFERGLFTDRASINETIPALAGGSAANSGPYAGAGMAMAASIIIIQLADNR